MMLSYAIFCHLMFLMASCDVLWYIELSYAILCFIMLAYAILCHVLMLAYAI